MTEKFFTKLISNPKSSCLGMIFITFILGLFIPNLEFDFSIEHLFSQDDPAVDRYFSFRDRFGREDNIVTIVYKPEDSFSKELYIELEQLVYKIKEIQGVEDIISIFSLSDIDTKAWIGDIYDEETDWKREVIEEKLNYIRSDPSIGSRILSKDLKFGSMIIRLLDDVNNHRDRANLISKIKHLTKNTSPDWTFSGVTVLRTEYVKYMIRENFIFLPPIALILITIMTYIFRNWVLVFLPLLTVIITVIWLLGFMGLFGLEINIITYIVPTLLFIIGISDAIHIQARFKENLAQDPDNPKEALLLTMLQMSKVIFLTSITTAIGFFALTTTSIKIIQEFGFEISLGVMIAWFTSIIIIPTGILLFKSYHQRDKKTFSRLLVFLSNSIPRNPWPYIFIPLLISFSLIYKIKDISTDASLMDDLRPNNQLYKDLKITEKYFGGILPFEILIHLEDDSTSGKTIFDEDILIQLNKVQSLLNKELPESRFLSFLDAFNSAKRITSIQGQSLKDKDIIRRLAESNPKGKLRLFSEDGKTLRINGLIENKTSSEMELIYYKLDSLSKSFPSYINLEYTGTTVVALRTNNYIVQSLIESLGIALFFISIVMAFMFRAKSILFASLVTNLIPIFTMLGILALLDISIRPPTAMTFAVALGIAVDDSLHFLLRYRKELNSKKDKVKAIRSTIVHTGSALMVTTTILVSGFSILLLSSFLPTYQFGLLSAMMIGIALLCDLTLLPALCIILPIQDDN